MLDTMDKTPNKRLLAPEHESRLCSVVSLLRSFRVWQLSTPLLGLFGFQPRRDQQ